MTASIADRLFRSPNPGLSLIGIFLASSGATLVIFYDPQRPLLDQITILWKLILVVLLPAYLTVFLTLVYALKTGGVMYLRRASLLVLLSLLWIIPVALCSRLISLDEGYLIALTAASPIWLRHVILTGTSDHRHHIVLPSSLMHSVLILIPALFLTPVTMSDLPFFVYALIAHLMTAYLFVRTVSAPFRSAFNYDPSRLVIHGLEVFTTGRGKPVEDFFSRISTRGEVWFSLVSVRRKKRRPILLISTSLHPGPFGTVGGGDLPRKIETRLGRGDHVLVFHGPGSHDMNPPTSAAVFRLARCLQKAIDDVQYSEFASRMIQISFSGSTLSAQRLGNSVLLVYTSAPDPTDDVDCPVAFEAMSGIRSDDVCMMFIDAHNSSKKGTGYVHYGTREARAIVDSASEIADRILAVSGFRAGFGYFTDAEFENDIASGGVKALVIETLGERSAYVLIDGNNLLSGLRDRLLKALSDLVHRAEIFTTDNHAVNATIGGYNPVGSRTSERIIKRAVISAVKQAIRDLDDAEAGGVERVIPDFPLLGHGMTARLTAVSSAGTSVLRWASILSISLTYALCAIPITFMT